MAPGSRYVFAFAASALFILCFQVAKATRESVADDCNATQTMAYVDVANPEGVFIDVFCGSQTSAIARIPLARRPTEAMDHGSDGRVYVLQGETAAGTAGELLTIANDRIATSVSVPDHPRAMAVDRSRGEIYVIRAARDNDPAWKPEFSVFDVNTLELKRSYKAGAFSGRWLLTIDSHSNAIVAPMDAMPHYIAVLRGGDGHLLQTFPQGGCAIQATSDALYVVSCLGDLIRYNPVTYREESREIRTSHPSITSELPASAIVGNSGQLYLANSFANQLVMYRNGEHVPFKRIDSISIENMQLDRKGELYVLVGNPQLPNVAPRLDRYDGTSGALLRTYQFDKGTYPFAMTVVSH